MQLQNQARVVACMEHSAWDHARARYGRPAHQAGCLQRGALEDALRQLYLLDALDSDGRVTALGRAMCALPLEPSLARSLLAAVDLDCLPDALTVAAMLSAESVFAGNRCAGHVASTWRSCC